jgi:alginate O-acetyltransferase complex protein AlgI
MLFNSLEFLAFLVVVLALYHGAIPRRFWGARKVALIVASYLFYMNWNPYFGAILLGSTVCDFTLGLVIQRAQTPARRRLCVAASVCVNLGILCFFKYGNFLLANGASVLSLVAGPVVPPALEIVLPIGISFYTFESLSYVIDVYRGMPAARNFLDFALFLSFFPHLVAGPIVRPAAFLPQLLRAPRVDGPLVEAALARIAVGLVKKVVFADTFGLYVDSVYGSAARPTRCSASIPTLSRSTSTFRATRTWRSAWPCCSGSACRRTSTGRTSPRVRATSGAAGTSRSRRGCATTSTSRSAATGAPRDART